MVLVPFFDIPSGFWLEKITLECPFQGPVFFGLLHLEMLIKHKMDQILGTSKMISIVQDLSKTYDTVPAPA